MSDQLAPYVVEARNTATTSENKIHDDATARRFGFAGGLVPGVTIYAYMTRPVAAAWGRPWLERGTMTARFLHPFYEGDAVRVETTRADGPDGARLEIVARRPDGEVAATGVATLPDAPASPPDVAAYPAAPLPDPRPPATPEQLAALVVLGSVEAGFRAERAGAFLDEIADDLVLYRDGVAHPGWLILFANWALSQNVDLGPWIHVESATTHLDVVADGEALSVRGRVAELFERKGHEFVVLDLLYVVDGHRPVQQVRHTAIYRLRGDRGDVERATGIEPA
jgi:hypothetical protein